MNQAKLEKHWRFWLIVGVIAAAILWLIGPVLLPFVMALVMAYLLDPCVDKVQKLKLSRGWATVAVLGFFMALIALLLVLLVPLISDQLVRFIGALPEYIQRFREYVMPLVQRYAGQISPEDAERLREAASNFSGTAVTWATGVAGGVWSGGQALFNIVSLVLITPVVAFYLLRDWDKLVARIDAWLPQAYAPIIRTEMKEIDRTLAGFMRGQAAVCVVLGLFYGISLSLIGLNFGLTVGLAAGLLSFIPYVGSLVGFLTSVGIAFFQYDSYGPVLVVAGIFLFGQMIEGNFLTPRLVGSKVGLHPVWVMLALLAGAHLFGFVGVLLAVPVAAVAGVLIRFAFGRYLESSYYKGHK